MLMSGRVILITNVRHYAGPAAVTKLAADGARLVCHDASFADPKAQAEWAQAHPGVLATSAQTPEDVVGAALAAHGRIDALVSNDEFPALRAPVEHAKLDDLRAGLEAMVVRPFAYAQAAVGPMRKQGSGRLLLITSAAPLRGIANYSMYATARGAANALMLSLSKELAPHQITVNAVAPNYMDNPTYFPPSLTSNAEAMAKMLKNIPLGRLGRPEELGALIAFFCVGECEFVTGHVIPIAGGWA
jgi:NAD(P)-dependent dehydrogenase (short-subunit alcohol dehydrogenase family)